MPVSNKLLAEGAVPEAIRNKVCEYLALNYAPPMISLMIEDQHNGFQILPRHIMEFAVLNRDSIVNWRKKAAKERAITRDSLIRKMSALLSRRMDRAMEDFQAYETLSQKRAEDTISEDEYKRRTSVLYLPTSTELLNLTNAIDKRITAPPPKSTDEQVDDDEPKPIVDPERQRRIEEATRNGDMITLQELMFKD